MSKKQHFDRQKVLTWLEKNVSKARINHILGVEATCIDLAKRYDISTKKAAKAGLLHDLAKFFPPDKLLKMARQSSIEIDAICQQHPHLLHAEVSSIVANQEFGVTNPSILKAIGNHTLGNPEMSPLSCILYVADTIEPTRGDTAELARLRKIAGEDIYHAVWQTSDYVLAHLIKHYRLIHPRTILTRNWALQTTKKIKS